MGLCAFYSTLLLTALKNKVYLKAKEKMVSMCKKWLAKSWLKFKENPEKRVYSRVGRGTWGHFLS